MSSTWVSSSFTVVPRTYPWVGWLVFLIAGIARAADPPQPPQVLFQDLYAAVESSGIYADSKTFADAVPVHAPDVILRNYHAQHPVSTAALQQFIAKNFALAPSVNASAVARRAGKSESLAAHIDGLWRVLERNSDKTPAFSSALPLPRPYVVPGGRFRELYYWDSYFTMLGLQASGRQDLVQDMVSDFASLIERYGHVPNGTRTYYLGRSQPPFFFEMVALLNPDDPAVPWARYLPQLKREYAFWMDGSAGLAIQGAVRRVVRLPDGAILNRYWDDIDLPRDESWREDTQLAKASARNPKGLYRDIRAAAESGWDFSSRWLKDPRSLASIQTTLIIPVDLNSLLYGLERAIRAGCERAADQACAREFELHAAQRHRAIDRYLWDDNAGSYFDYQWHDAQRTRVLSAATLYPLFESAASPAQATRVAAVVRQSLLARNGIATTTVETGQQWDAPNGWAPLQWIAVQGLRNSGARPLAAVIACRWLVNVAAAYHYSGKLVEKYNVATQGGGGGGEYPLQDGFGWTNGVTRRLMVLYPMDAGMSDDRCPRDH